ncbi:drug/metabolite transporter (DMT)-like permease [Pseudomonas nitritireducens]|uniref:Drug/metabolite transporter (DMT)-like permease n=1 Tax=Pseudomonas nitroreducens TaxID=46680 RepID=A0A7W7P2N1_PSENT|nr:DMT family transporter [Pseudomonas nitritireducens]MBB4865776.1 drug/metabolite transporter (DMT)-like permease [Pseudomonas nitritireducens]
MRLMRFRLANPHSQGFFLVLLAAFCYGLQPLFASFAYAGGANPVGLLLARFAIAAALLLMGLQYRRIRLPGARLIRQNLILGVGYGLAALGYYSAARASSVSLAVILMYSFPAIVTAVSIAWLGERTSALKLIALLLALGGVTLATGLSLKGLSVGALWALFAAMAYGSAIIYGTRRIRHDHPLASAAVVLLGCAATFAVAALTEEARFPATGQAWLATAGLALFATVIPVAAFLAGSPAVGPSTAATLSTLEPLVAVAIAVWLMGEQLTLGMLGGGLMVLLAAVCLARPAPGIPVASPVAEGAGLDR